LRKLSCEAIRESKWKPLWRNYEKVSNISRNTNN